MRDWIKERTYWRWVGGQAHSIVKRKRGREEGLCGPHLDGLNHIGDRQARGVDARLAREGR